MLADSEGIHCCGLFEMEEILTLFRRLRREGDMSSGNQGSSRVEAEVAGNRVLAKEAHLGKPWSMPPDRVADLLADLVFLTLMLLLFVWVGLWTVIH